MPSSSSSSSSFSLVVFLLFSLCLVSNGATDSLIPGQSISTSDFSTLVSSNGIFELGFVSPGNSSNRYVGIWYHNISKEPTIWIANREAPILPTQSASLTLTETGNVEILVGTANGNVSIWSTPATSSSINSTLQLSNDGNLMLTDESANTLWQSFDHLTDTFIQGMHLGFDTKTGKSQVISSWRSPDDPAPGNFTMGLDPNGSTQVFIWKNNFTKFWRSGEWNGASNFLGIPWRPLYSMGFTFNHINSQSFYTYTAANNSLQRFRLHSNGTESIYMYLGGVGVRGWEDFWNQPVKECEIYNWCGSNAVCENVEGGGEGRCECLMGFEGKNGEGNRTGGCVRKEELGCVNGKKDGYKRYPGAKLPDFTQRVPNIADSPTCESYCTKNCSCNAYAFLSTVGCMMWSGDLMDVYHFDDGGYDLFVKVPASLLGSKNKVGIIAGTVSAFVVLMLLLCIFIYWRFIRSPKPKGSITTSRKSKSQSSLGLIRSKEDFSGPSQFTEESEDGKNSELPLFTFDYLASVTNNFGISNKLGEGGFGLVYKGSLTTDEEVAVKRLSATSGQGVGEFKNEVILIAKLQHRNLVRLLGCCIQGDERMLVYEYLPNKSLDAFLFDPSKRGLLDWKTRFNIIEGIARGLLYLHRDSRLRVVHRDLKASNILLDKDMEPKISDFGMARIFGGDQNQENTNRVVGTLGYMSPEYAMEGLFSIKSDVYSFGILIMEIITGDKSSSFHNRDDSGTVNIVGYAYKMWSEDKSLDLIDPTIKHPSSIPGALKCIHVGLLCVQDLAHDRPDISQVIQWLTSENPNLPLPRRPTFTSHGYSSETSAVKSSDELMMSTSDVTITRLQGR
ncbi:hypothetical protein LUZ60_010633 [Juncus effusus]|nr:hypothetical protein LUZ60_010633 [Juncus effusus]